MRNNLLMVIPATVRWTGSEYEVDEDCSHNLREYLKSFSTVTFACPIPIRETFNIVRSIPMNQIDGHERLSFMRLPCPYREDRYFQHYLSVRSLLSAEIDKSEFLLFSPHAKYDWSTLAANLAISRGR